MRNLNLLFVAIVLISALGQVTSDLYLPSLPILTEDLWSSSHISQLTITLFMIGLSLSSLVYGPLSDGIGRRKPLLLGMILSSVGSLLCMISPNIVLLIIARFVQGVGAGAATTLFRSMLRDLFQGEKLAKYGSYSALISIGAIALAPLLGGYIQQYFGWRANFAFLFICALVALAYVLFRLPETNQHLHPENLQFKTIKKNLVALITHPLFLSYSLLNLLAYGSILAWVTAGPFLLQRRLGLTPVEFGWSYAITGISFALGAVTNSFYVSRVGLSRMLIIGICCALVSGLVMLVAGLMGYLNVLVILGPVVILLYSMPLIFNNAFAGAFNSFPKIAGIAGSLFGAMTALGGAITSSLLALSSGQNQVPLAITITTSALIALIIFVGVIKKNENYSA